MNSYKEIKKAFKEAAICIAAEDKSNEINEAAVPAYANKNPLIDYLFWKRLKVACSFVEPGKDVLDFGCGTGVFSYIISGKSNSITALDIESKAYDAITRDISFPENVNFVCKDIFTHHFDDQSFDIIIAMDVLEHVDDLPDLITEFQRVLKPEGKIIVSGPTENWLYKAGRKIAGKRYSGEYHVSNIETIRSDFEKQMKIEKSKSLFPLITFFKVMVIH